MKYEFNTTRFAQILRERNLKKTPAARMLGRKNSDTIQNWMDGEKIESTHLVQICNIFNVSPAEFFLENGEPIVPPKKVEFTSGIDKIQTPSVSKKEASNMNQDEISDVSQANIIAFLHERLEFEKERFMFQKQKNEYELKQMQRELDEIRKELKREYGSEAI